MLRDHSRNAKSARQLLAESTRESESGSGSVGRLVGLLDGRLTNSDIAPEDWIRGVEAVDGRVAVYLGCVEDRKLWIGYDGACWHRWSLSPRGTRDHHRDDRDGILVQTIEDEYRYGGIRRSKVVRVDDAPEFVTRTIETARNDPRTEREGES